MSDNPIPEGPDVVMIRRADKPKMVPGGHREQLPVPYEEFPAREWEDAFLTSYRVYPNVGNSCAIAGISRATFLNWKKKCARFREEVEHAHEDGLDAIEYRMMQRAKEKDTLAGIFILRNQRPDVYGDKPVARSNAPVSFTLQIGGPVGNQEEPKTIASKAVTVTPMIEGTPETSPVAA
jgi:hypothetical protein